jgi:hypothetical protein
MSATAVPSRRAPVFFYVVLDERVLFASLRELQLLDMRVLDISMFQLRRSNLQFVGWQFF